MMQMTDAEYAQLLAETDQVLLDVNVKHLMTPEPELIQYQKFEQIMSDAEYARVISMIDEPINVVTADIYEEKEPILDTLPPNIVQCPNCGIYIDVEINCSIFRCAYITEAGTGLTKDQVAHASLEKLLKWRADGIIHSDIGCLVPFRVAAIGSTPYILYKNGNLDYNS